MFCSKCGSEISSKDSFCSVCGTKVETFYEVEPVEKTKNKSMVITLGIVSALLIVILVVMGVLFFEMSSKQDDEVVSKIEKSDTNKKGLDKEEQDEWGEAEEEQEQLEEQQEVVIEETLVCVPADSMSLRSTPGLGDDVITDLYAGTQLTWHGQQETVNDVLFYKVIVEQTGQEGFVSANFCTPVDYVCDDKLLGIVNVNTELYTYDMMIHDMEQIQQLYPDRITYNWLGESLDARDIFEIILGNPNAEHHVMVQATIHGREYMNTQLIMRMIEYYAAYYDDGSYNGVSYRDLFNKTAFHIVPMSNPDGVSICQFGEEGLDNSYYRELLWYCYERDKYFLEYKQDSLGDMNWTDYYKDENYERDDSLDYISFDEYLRLWKANAKGVDLNKNFDAEWDGIIAKDDYAYSDYKGPYSLSEPESQILAELAQKYDYLCYMSYHSKGELIYYDVEGNTSYNSAASNGFATLLESKIKYKPVQTTKGYNVSLGGFGDWVQLKLNKPSVTIESGKHPCPLSVTEFPAMWNRHRETWAMIAEDIY